MSVHECVDYIEFCLTQRSGRGLDTDTIFFKRTVKHIAEQKNGCKSVANIHLLFISMTLIDSKKIIYDVVYQVCVMSEIGI